MHMRNQCVFLSQCAQSFVDNVFRCSHPLSLSLSMFSHILLQAESEAFCRRPFWSVESESVSEDVKESVV